MSVASEITRIQGAKADLKASINAKTDLQHQITTETIDDYADFVDNIQTGGNLQNKSVTITTNTTTIITADSGYDGLDEVEVVTNVEGGIPQITSLSALNNYGKLIFNSFSNYLSGLPNNYEPYTNSSITLYTPNVNCKNYMIQKRNDGTFRIVWSYYGCVLINSATTQGFYDFNINNYDGLQNQRTKKLGDLTLTLFNINLSSQLPNPYKISYYSKTFPTFEGLILALQDSTHANITYTEYKSGSDFAGVIDASYNVPYTNCPVFNNSFELITNAKIISKNETILNS